MKIHAKILTIVAAAALASACAIGSAGCGTDASSDASAPRRFADGDTMPAYLLGYYSLKAGDAAPDFTVELVDADGLTGETLRLADLSGQVVLLDFWAPWCPYCIADMPSWQTIAEEYGDSVVILAVDVGGDTFGEMKQFIAKSGYDFTWGIINADMAQAYPFAGVPYDVIIGKDGTIVFVAEGSYGTHAYRVMASQLDEALAA